MLDSIKNRVQKWNRAACILVLIMAVGSLVRLTALDRWTLGLHQDEAFSAYNAWSVMNYGVDSEGYIRPVYYTVWGSGMSVLYSWLEMPFIAMLGATVWAIRLPQAIIGCLAILSAYFFGCELFDKKMGLAFAAMLAINPWHILQSRFGLDANLAAPMLLFGMTFLCRYLNGKRKSLLPATIFLGLTLYCYAITWPLVPLILVLTLIFYRKRIRFDRKLWGCVALLFLIALPLILFMMINLGWMPEIRTALFSVPRLAQMRTEEFGFRNLYRNFRWNLAVLWAQYDNIWWITNKEVGAYYYISTPFILLGMIVHAWEFFKVLRKRQELPLHFMMAIWFGAMFVIGLGVERGLFYKLNCLHIPIIFYGIYGLAATIRYLKRFRWLPKFCVGVYLVSFCYFVYSVVSYPVDYSTFGNPLVSHMLYNGYEAALDRARQLTDGEISVIGLNYANVLWDSLTPPDVFAATVTYSGDDLAFRHVDSFDRYHFDVMPSEDNRGWVYVFPRFSVDTFRDMGYKVEEITDCYSIGYLEDLYRQ